MTRLGFLHAMHAAKENENFVRRPTIAMLGVDDFISLQQDVLPHSAELVKLDMTSPESLLLTSLSQRGIPAFFYCGVLVIRSAYQRGFLLA